ncbi:MAG: deoxynucleoside kinase [Deltaproteobacteria bacterium]|nr:deoxynucleoside kinase [Deltaproteobacteria bacterium]
MERARYIAIDGPIGVGKSSLAECLAEEFEGRTITEDFENNPFLPGFYSDREKNAFQTQIFFLLSRYQQQKVLGQQELFSTTIISDYLFAKDRIFAYLNLDEAELALYEQIFRLLDGTIPKPDLVVYLQASTEVLKERIKRRNKPYEINIGDDYIEELVEAYNKYFFYYSDSPLLVVNTTDIDFMKSPADLSDLVEEIRSIKAGVHHYIPLGSRT